MTAHAGLSARQVLYGADPAAISHLGQALHHLGAAESALRGVRRLPRSVLRPVDGQIAVTASSQLDHDLGGMLLDGWHRYGALHEAAERTLVAPGTEEDVTLVTHMVSATRRPRVDVLVDGSRVHSFEFALEVQFALTAVAGVVREGSLIALRSGDCHLTVTLRLGDRTLASREAHVDLAVLLPLEWPIPLTDEAARRLRLHGGRRS